MCENLLSVFVLYSFNSARENRSGATMSSRRSYLTPRQIQVLELKIRGNSVSQIARKLRTSRSNVSRLLKTAEENIERAKNTLKLLETLEWPVKVVARKNTNIYEVAERVFKSADQRGIKIAHNYAEVVRIITEFLGRRGLRRRRALRSFVVVVSADGKLEVI